MTTVNFQNDSSHNASSLNSDDITLDFTSAANLKTAVVYNSGESEPTITPAPKYPVGQFKEGFVNIYYFCYDADLQGATLNIVNTEEVFTPPADPILFEDDFTGATIDLNKWVIYNPDDDKIAVSQNNELLYTDIGTATTNPTPNEGIRTPSTFLLDTTQGDRYINFEIDRTGKNTDFSFALIVGDYQNIIRVRELENGNLELFNTVNGVNRSIVSSSEKLDGTFKIALENEVCSVYKWNGSGFDFVISDVFGDSSDYFLSLHRHWSRVDGEVTKLKSIAVSTENFNTQYA